MRPKAASRVNETTLEPSRTTRSNELDHGLHECRAAAAARLSQEASERQRKPRDGDEPAGCQPPALMEMPPGSGRRRAEEYAAAGDPGRRVQGGAPAALPAIG